MGTTYSVKVVVPNEISEQRRFEVGQAVERAAEDVNERMSTYRADSELSRFNRRASTEPFPVSDDVFAVFVEARRIGRASGGAFDVTVGPLVNAWGFGPERRGEPPSAERLAELRARVGWDKLVIDDNGHMLKKLHPGLYCDLSAIAKGFAVDQVSRALADLGFLDHMVEIGGEVRASGVNSEGRAWRIGIERPAENGQAVARVPALENLSLATSGDYRNYYEQAGKRLSHTIDPRTGRPIEHRLASVSVVAPSCMTADGWATALMALGEDEGFETAVSEDLAALFQIRQPDGSVAERATPAFAQRFGAPEHLK